MNNLCPECLSDDLIALGNGLYQCESCGHAMSIDELVEDNFEDDDYFDEDEEDFIEEPFNSQEIDDEDQHY